MTETKAPYITAPTAADLKRMRAELAKADAIVRAVTTEIGPIAKNGGDWWQLACLLRDNVPARKWMLKMIQEIEGEE